jgi:uncharacterized protein YggE
VEDAVAKAKTLASAAGVTLGPILSIEENSGFQPVPRFMAMAAQAKDSAVPVATGESTLTVNVNLTYAIQ